MDDKQLRAFTVIADCGSFNKAGEVLFLSKQAVMKHINSLEKEIGFRLVDRSSAGITLTAAGAAFLKDIQQIQRHLGYRLEQCRALADERLTLCIDTLAPPCPLLTQAVAAYAKAYPNVLVRMSRRRLGCSIRDVLQTADIVEYRMDAPVSLSGAVCWQIAAPAYQCLLSPAHPLACQDSVKRSDLHGSRIAYSCHERSEQLLAMTADVGGPLQELRDTDPLHIINWCLEGGIYLAPVKIPDAPLAALPLSQQLTGTENLIYHADPAPKVRTFLQILNTQCLTALL